MQILDARAEKLTLRARCLLLGGVALIVALRAPLLVLVPRLWAEEASVHLAYAFNHGVLRSLLLIPTADAPAGYLNLAANIPATLAAHLFPLEMAPILTTATAFVLQLLPAVIVLWGRSRLWSTPGRRIACLMVLLVAPSLRPDVWLTTVNSQVFCGLTAFLILFEDMNGAGMRRIWLYRLVLLFCGLSGVYTGLLTPPYLLRAYTEESRESRVQLGIVAGTALIQLVAYLATVLLLSIAPDRVAGFAWSTAASVVLFQHLVQSIVGTPLSDLGMRAFVDAMAPGAALGSVSLLLLGAFWVWLWRGRGSAQFSLFPLSFMVLAAAASVLGHGLPQRRYAVLSGMVVLLALLCSSWGSGGLWRRRVCGVLVAVSLCAGLATYWMDSPVVHRGQRVGHFGTAPGRPDWRVEVERWRQDPMHELRVWPYTQLEWWKTHLVPWAAYREAQSAFNEVEDFHLVAADRASERRVGVPGLPPDFRVLVRGSGGSHSPDLQLTVVFEDKAHEPLCSWALQDLPAGEPFIRHELSRHLELPRGRSFQDVRYVVARAEILSSGTATVAVERVEIAPRIEGLLDDLLPAQTLPTRLYSASAIAPLAQEAIPILALESLLEDGDFVYGQVDAQRGRERWMGRNWLSQAASSGIHLANGLPIYHEPLPFLLVALPLFALGGASGVVLLNAILVLSLVLMTWRDFEGQGRVAQLFGAGTIVAAAGCGFLFLPQSQIFEAFCLFVPVRWWLRGELDGAWLGPAGMRLLASAVLLAAATVQDLAWVVILGALVSDLLVQRRVRPALSLALSAAAFMTLLWVAGHLLANSSLAAHVNPDLSVLESPPPVAFELSRWASSTWRIYLNRKGLLVGYPFAILALVFFARGPEQRSRLVLFGALVGLVAWITFRHAGAALESPLGSPHFASIYPLFSLLAVRTGSWRTLLFPMTVAILLTLGIMSAAWTPL